MCEVKGEAINASREEFWCDLEPIIKAAAIAAYASDRVEEILRHEGYWTVRAHVIRATGKLEEAAELLYELGFSFADEMGEGDFFEDAVADAKGRPSSRQ